MRKLVFLAFMLYVGAEVAVLIEAGHRFGLGWVMAWVGATLLVGLAALRTQGVRSLRRMALQLQREILPTKELVDLALVVTGALLLISPGFIADAFGLVLLVPFGRAAVRGFVFHWLPRWLPDEPPDVRLRTAASNVIEIEREPHG